MPALQTLHHSQIHFQKLWKKRPLHHITRIRRAPLLTKLEPLLDLGRQILPIREFPHPITVHPVHLQHVPLRSVIKGRRNLPPVILSTYKSQTGNRLIPHQGIAQLPPRTADQTYRQSTPPRQGHRQGHRMNPPVRRRLRNHRVPRQALHQHRVNQNRKRIVPRSNIRNQP